jgi:aerobic carbon-monoxide dehydrogenase small subunit
LIWRAREEIVKQKIWVTVNGVSHEMEVEPRLLLIDLLRNHLELTGTKLGCGHGDCGACTVLVDGKPANACLLLAVEVDGKKVTTIEGLAEAQRLHPVQQAFIDHGAMQCGFCIPGMILSAKALLDETPHPTEEQVRDAIAGNLCRCTGYAKIVQAILSVSKSL